MVQFAAQNTEAVYLLLSLLEVYSSKSTEDYKALFLLQKSAPQILLVPLQIYPAPWISQASHVFETLSLTCALTHSPIRWPKSRHLPTVMCSVASPTHFSLLYLELPAMKLQLVETGLEGQWETWLSTEPAQGTINTTSSYLITSSSSDAQTLKPGFEYWCFWTEMVVDTDLSWRG